MSESGGQPSSGLRKPKLFGTGLIFLAMAGLLVVSLAFTYWVGYLALQSNRELVQRQELVRGVQDLLSTLKDAETGQRGYLLTGDESYLAPYTNARQQVRHDLERLVSRADEHWLDPKAVSDLKQLTLEKIAELEQTVTLRRVDNVDAALAVVRSERGKQLMDALRTQATAISDEAGAKFQQASARVSRATKIRTFAFFATAVLNIGFLTWARRRINFEIERQRTGRAELARSTARFNAVIHSAMDAIISIDARQRIVLFNPAAERMFDYTAAQALGMQVNQLIPQRFREAHSRHVEDFAHTGVSSRRMGRLGELVAVRKNGQEFPIEASIAQTDADGEKLFTVILRDITERVRSETELRQTQERFRTLADAMPQLAWISAPDGSVTWFNRRWYEYTGSTPDQMQGWGWQSAQDPKSLPQVLERWRASSASGQPFEMEIPLRDAHGAFRPFLTRVVPIRDETGQILQWFGTGTDITDIVAAREALSRSRAELERLVTDRTAQLAEANVNLQTFAYSAAHDLRAPLRTIRNFSAILLEEQSARLEPDGREMLQRVVASSQQMEQLLADLLEYSKVSQTEVKLTPISLQTAAQEALNLLDGEISRRDASVGISEPLPEAVGHLATTVLVINNLVTNALKFTPAGVKPDVRIFSQARNGSVRLVVQDNGIGISPSDVSKLFSPFQRLHSRQSYPGTGLGLAIVRRGAERMGGQVGVESEEGKGSRFWIELPAAHTS